MFLWYVQNKLSEALQYMMVVLSPYFEDWTTHDPNLPFTTVAHVMSETKVNGITNWSADQVKMLWCPPNVNKDDRTLNGIVVEMVSSCCYYSFPLLIFLYSDSASSICDC
jgi:hypothetical protein